MDTVHQRADTVQTVVALTAWELRGLPGHFPQFPGLESKLHKKEVKKGDESRLVQAKDPVGSQGSSRQERLSEMEGDAPIPALAGGAVSGHGWSRLS